MTNKIEKQLVEDYLVEALSNKGWNFVDAKDLKRSFRDAILEDDFRFAIKKLNSHIKIGDEEVEKVLHKIQLIPNSPEGGKELMRYLKYGIGIKFENEKVVKFVTLINYDDPQANDFLISRQVVFRAGQEEIVPDIVLFVNGLPISVIECKNPASLAVSWQDGYRQIQQYWQKVAEPFKYAQIGIAAASEARYFPIVPWEKEDVKTYKWREEGKDDIEAIVEFLAPEKLLDFIRNFLFIREERGRIIKVMARYMQYRAVNKIYDRVVGNIRGEEIKNKGLIWHWQGSGKTYSMIFAGHKLFFDKNLDNPTIFFIIDRKELEEQISNELKALNLNYSHQKIDNVQDLKDVIRADNFQGKRGVFVTLMQKYRADEKFIPDEMVKEITGLTTKSIADRKNVIVFLDEVQRTQYGLLAAQMRNIFANSFFFGFTGTPITEDERDTYKEFGYPIEENKELYLDKYFVNDSLSDGFTVPIAWEPRKEKDITINKSDLQAFIDFEIDELDADSKTKLEDKLQKKLDKIKIFLENESRVKNNAKDIAVHFQKNVDGKFKAMVVASRKACVLYKKYLDEIINPSDTEIVMTFNPKKDEKMVCDFYRNWKKRYSDCKRDDEIVKKIVNEFKSSEFPKILIVTDMLLTGFDEPKLQTMYLDKPMKKHKLLQAVARVNRLYGDLKAAGLIIDYIGILEEAKKAYQAYHKQDKMESVFIDREYLWKKFKEKLVVIENIFQGVPHDYSREIFIQATEALRGEKEEKEFIESFKELRKIFELLGMEKEKLDYLETYKWISSVYFYFIKLKNDDEESQRKLIDKYFNKTIEAISQNLQIKEINNQIPQVEFGIKYFNDLLSSGLSKEEKAINSVFALEKLVLVDQRMDPIYKSVADKVLELVDKWKKRKIGLDLLFQGEVEIINDLKKKQSERNELSLNNFEFGVYLIFKNELKANNNDARGLTRELFKNLSPQMIGNWLENPVISQNIFRDVRDFLVQKKPVYKYSLDEMNKIYNKLVEILCAYES